MDVLTLPGHPCDGHPCDRCTRCEAGDCCGADVVDADLPVEGTWPGPWPDGVRVGVFEERPDTVRCSCCGEWKAALPNHIRVHGLDADTYRAVWGLNCGQPLISPVMRAARSARAVGRRISLGLTAEQLSAAGRNRWARPQARTGWKAPSVEHQSAASRARWERPDARDGLILARRRRRKPSEGKTCPECGAQFCSVPGRGTALKLCGAEDCRRAAKSRAAAASHRPGSRRSS